MEKQSAYGPAHSRVSMWLMRVFYAVFTAFFLWILIHVIFINEQGFDPILSLFLMAVFLALFFGAYAVTGMVDLTVRTGTRILLVFILTMGILQIVAGLRLRYTPAFDLDAIFGGGRDWALTGNFDRYHDYFGMFSNNLGGLFLYRCLFSFGHLLGVGDYYALALVYNTTMLQVMVWAVYDTARRLAGVRAAVLSLVMFGAFLPFCMMGAVFYTDLLSAPFAALCIDFYLRAKSEIRLKQKTVFFCCFGIAAAIGAALKFTVIIVAIAAVLDFLLGIRWNTLKGLPARRIIAHVAIPASALGIAAALLAGFYGYMNAQQDAAFVSSRRLPVTHWIMMGLNGNGQYDPGEYDFSMGLPDLAARREEIPKVIYMRIRERGFSGMFALGTEKVTIDFGDGTYHLFDFLADGPVNETALHDLVLTDGQHYDAYKHIAQGAYLAFFLLMLAGGVRSAVCPGRFTVPWLAMFGLLLFLLLWETNTRYTQNFMPVLILCAALGVCTVSDKTALQPREI